VGVDNVAGIFERIWDRHWGPRTDYIMRHACQTLTQVPGATLAEITELLIKFEWRRARATTRSLTADIACSSFSKGRGTGPT
jgi:hypothetical protein